MMSSYPIIAAALIATGSSDVINPDLPMPYR